MTEKLYEKNPYKKSFRADVEKIEKKDNKYYVILNKTYFYPEGGGQPSDKGKIDGKEVQYVYKKDNDIIHLLKDKPDNEKDLLCEVDWSRRFDLMQQHTGQHLLSAVFKNDYDINTVGFTLTEESLRIDLDKQIDEDKIAIVEAKVNNYIYKNINIETKYPSQNTLKELDLRKEPTVDENVRVIQIGDIDFSPCGGTHLKSTAEIGLIKITNVENYKGGLRIEFVCGKRALKDYDFKNDITIKLRDILSVPEDEIIQEVKRYQKEIKKKDNIISDMNKELLDYKAEELLSSAETIKDKKIVKKIFTDIDYNDVQWLSDILCKDDNVICLFGQKEGSTARLLLSKSNNIEQINMNEVINKPLNLIEGRGGGSTQKAQGGGNNTTKLNEAVETAYRLIKKKL